MEYLSCRLPVWILAIIVSLAGTLAEDDNFCPISSYSCSQNGISCSIIRDPECSWTSAMAQNANEYPGPVTDFSVEPHYLTPKTNVTPNSISRVEISWGLPENKTHRYLNGFKVRLIQANNVPYCFVFQLNVPDHSAWDKLDKSKFKYNLTCDKLHNRGYTIDVTSLPDAPFSDKRASAMLKIVQKYKDDQTHGCSDPSNKDCWDTDMVIYNDQCSRTIRVTFTRAPDVMGIPGYKISLMPPEYFAMADASVSITKITKTQFLEGVMSTGTLTLPLHNRSIVVSPLCGPLNNCGVSVSQNFHIINATAAECTFIPPDIKPTPIGPVSPDQLSTSALIGIIVASIVVAGALTAVITILARRRMRRGSSSDDLCYLSGAGSYGFSNVNADQPPIPPSPPDLEYLQNRKMVFLLYSNDSPQHRTVIGHLQAFLESKGLNVVFDRIHLQQSRQDMMGWTKEYMDKCDYILLINSKGTFMKSNGYTYQMFDSMSDCIDTFSPGLTILLENLQHPEPVLIHKVVMCHFEYTAYEHSSIPRIPQLQSQFKVNYRLMNQVDDMLGCLGHSGSYSHDDDETGRSLDTAISMKRQFIKENPNWFETINGQPEALRSSTSTQDSGFYSIEASGTSSNPGLVINGSLQIPNSKAGMSQTQSVPDPLIQHPSIPDDITTLDGSELGEEIANHINRERSVSSV